MTTIEEKHHARISPSGSKRWMKCPGSVRLISSLNIPSKPSRFAAEGTVAHEVCEKALKEGRHPSEYIGRTFTADGFKFKVTQEMADAVAVYTDYILESMESAATQADIDLDLKVEVWCSLEYLDIDGLEGGTSDCILINHEHNTIEVIDYKHGQGVSVEAENNSQALHYALGAMKLVDPKEEHEWQIYVTIIQPRAFHPKGPIRTWHIHSDYLIDWRESELIPKAKRTHDIDAELVPDDEGCRFCDAAAHCPKLLEKTQEIAMIDFSEKEIQVLPDIKSLSVEQKCAIMDHRDMIRSFLVAVENQIKSEVDAGSKDYEGKYKLVETQSRRKFIDDADDDLVSPLFDHLSRSDILEEKIKGIKDIESSLKKKYGAKKAREIMDEVTITPKGSLVIAPESDKRKAVQPSIIGDFNDLD